MRYISVKDAICMNPISVGPETSIEDCAKLMIKESVGSLIIKENDIIKGILTEKDFLEKVIQKNIDTKKTAVRKIMTSNLVTIDPYKDIIEAIKTMIEHNVRRLPVIENGKLVGLLTIKDILRIEPQLFDLITEKSKFLRSRDYTGECENCNIVSKLAKMDRKYLCSECRKIEKIINH